MQEVSRIFRHTEAGQWGNGMFHPSAMQKKETEGLERWLKVQKPSDALLFRSPGLFWEQRPGQSVSFTIPSPRGFCQAHFEAAGVREDSTRRKNVSPDQVSDLSKARGVS